MVNFFFHVEPLHINIEFYYPRESLARLHCLQRNCLFFKAPPTVFNDFFVTWTVPLCYFSVTLIVISRNLFGISSYRPGHLRCSKPLFVLSRFLPHMTCGV